MVYYFPSLSTLKKYALAVGCRLEIKLVPKSRPNKKTMGLAKKQATAWRLIRATVETNRLKIIDSAPWREVYPEYSEGQVIGKEVMISVKFAYPNLYVKGEKKQNTIIDQD